MPLYLTKVIEGCRRVGETIFICPRGIPIGTIIGKGLVSIVTGPYRAIRVVIRARILMTI